VSLSSNPRQTKKTRTEAETFEWKNRFQIFLHVSGKSTSFSYVLQYSSKNLEVKTQITLNKKAKFYSETKGGREYFTNSSVQNSGFLAT